MRRSGRATQGRYPGLAILILLFGHLAVASVAAQDIEVTAADPPEMEQAQTIDVIIKGNGFDSSAAARCQHRKAKMARPG